VGFVVAAAAMAIAARRLSVRRGCCVRAGPGLGLRTCRGDVDEAEGRKLLGLVGNCLGTAGLDALERNRPAITDSGDTTERQPRRPRNA